MWFIAPVARQQSTRQKLSVGCRVSKNVGRKNETAFRQRIGNFGKKKADPITEEDEINVWEIEVFGSKTVETLQHTVFLYLSKLFGLKGYDEHHALECRMLLEKNKVEDVSNQFQNCQISFHL